MNAFGKSPVKNISPKTTIIIGATARMGIVCEAIIHVKTLLIRQLCEAFFRSFKHEKIILPADVGLREMPFRLFSGLLLVSSLPARFFH